MRNIELENDLWKPTGIHVEEYHNKIYENLKLDNYYF
jgi:hypothetical protein